MQVFPLFCPRCGEPMRIIAFVTEVDSVQRILEHLGEPTQPPLIAPPPEVLLIGRRTSIHGTAIRSLGVSPYPSMSSTSGEAGKRAPPRPFLPVNVT